MPNTVTVWPVAECMLMVTSLIRLLLVSVVHGWVVAQKFHRTFEPLEGEPS